MVKNIFPLEDAIKQSAGLATGNAKDVGGTALKQQLSKMIAGVHKNQWT